MKTTEIKIALNIIGLFMTAILVSFIPDYLHEFFGDNFCIGNVEKEEMSYCEFGWSKYNNPHKNEWHWGYRHWLWLCMGISLAILQIRRIILIIDKGLK
jgi:hypothetical protein